jgi:hypothetical protein
MKFLLATKSDSENELKNKGRLFLSVLMLLLIQFPLLAGNGDTSWMIKGKYGIFMHYQYRILLNYSVMTNPKFPEPNQMTASEWNRFVDGFDVKGFANQMAQAKVGWVLFGLDDAYFGWMCAPNKAFSEFTGYAPGDKCTRRDLIMDVTDALNKKGIKVIIYYAGLNGYMMDSKVVAGLKDDAALRGVLGEKIPPKAECRKRRVDIFREFADRYKNKIAGWWFDIIEPNSYSESPDDWSTITSIIRKDNPKAVIAFSHGGNEFECVKPGIDDFTAGDTWSKQDLTSLTPKLRPVKGDILWHGKIYCGNVYHGQGDANQFTDQELIGWIKTCNQQGGVCTLDWPFNPKTGLIKDFGIQQMIRIGNVLK